MTLTYKLVSSLSNYEPVISQSQLTSWFSQMPPSDHLLLQRVRSYGHRFTRLVDSSHRIHENNLYTLHLSLSSPLDGLECDVTKTKDGRLVILHDTKALSYYQNSLAKELCYHEIESDIPSNHLLKLEELLEIFQEHVEQALQRNQTPKELNLEIKDQGIATDVLTKLQQFQTVQPFIVFSSFNRENLIQVLTESTYPISILIGQAPQNKSRNDYYIDMNLDYALTLLKKYPSRIASINPECILLRDPIVMNALQSCPVKAIYVFSAQSTRLDDSIHNPCTMVYFARQLQNKEFGVFIDNPLCTVLPNN